MCDEALVHGNATMSYNVSMHGNALTLDSMPT